jgi:drug/metabolite transporter (DMT)-like permease
VLELRRRDAGVTPPASTPGAGALTTRIALLLLVPPLMWSGNALVGRLLAGSVPPLRLNALRWSAALLILLPLGWAALSTPARRAEVRARWPRLALLGGLGVGAYNAFQYQALTTSTPINVTLIASSTPLWMMLIGILGYREHPRPAQWLGAALSALGVLVVLLRGDPTRLETLRLVPGDLWMLLAALSWALYSWQLARPPASMSGAARPAWDWAEFLLIQVMFGLGWAAFAAGGEALFGADGSAASRSAATGIASLGPLALVAALVFLALGPSVAAYRCWGLGVAAVGPAVAGFFANLTPLFAALLSAAGLGEPPQPYHALAFALVVGGILLSSRR